MSIMNRFLLLFGLLMVFSCTRNNSEINKSSSELDYEFKLELLKDYATDFFDKLEGKEISTEEKKYLKFIFTYMPLSDYGDYDFEFFLNQVKYAIKARETFSWGKSIPEDIFMQYVLPPRMNNENMDTSRLVFFTELKEKLLNMELSMEEAALEVNHWCHEKVNYRPTDERTISPLGAILSTYGRCGEESTFTTTALRSVGIPARQVYTPRWAHTDDNHAWVEVWINGNWYFMGACEPSPLLNRGWFEIPSTRTMLVHSKQFGKVYKQEKDYISENNNFVWVNALSNYAPTKMLEVLVVDEKEKPLSEVNVQFQLYNYAELYPIHIEKTDNNGKVKFKTGYGSLEIYVDNGKNFISKTVNPNDEGEIKIVLSNVNIFPSELVKYIPPVAGDAKPVNKELEDKNAERLLKEDSIRAIYESTFYNLEKAQQFAKKYKYHNDVCDYLIKSRGNWPEVESFLIESANISKQNEALKLLKVLAEKDLRDTRKTILCEHLEYAYKYYNEKLPSDIFENYVLNPRISFEMLKAYRKIILADISDSDIISFKNDYDKMTQYISSKIKTKLTVNDTEISCDDLNTYRVLISPNGVHKLKLSDERSYKVYYVAFCRSLGIPARIEQSSGFIQLYSNGKWIDMLFDKSEEGKLVKRGKINLVSAHDNRELKYRIHFSLARLEDAKFKTVDLGWEVPISDFSSGIELQTGEYMLLSSIRKEDGSVDVKRKYFELSENENLIVEVSLPDASFSKINNDKFVSSKIYTIGGDEINLKQIKDNGLYIVYCWLDPSKEPSKHIVRDLTSMIDELKKNKIEILFLVNDKNFVPEKHGFTKNQKYCYDRNFELLTKNTKCSVGGNVIVYPQIRMVNSDGDIIFFSEGYVIGIGESILSKIL